MTAPGLSPGHTGYLHMFEMAAACTASANGKTPSRNFSPLGRSVLIWLSGSINGRFQLDHNLSDREVLRKKRTGSRTDSRTYNGTSRTSRFLPCIERQHFLIQQVMSLRGTTPPDTALHWQTVLTRPSVEFDAEDESSCEEVDQVSC